MYKVNINVPIIKLMKKIIFPKLIMQVISFDFFTIQKDFEDFILNLDFQVHAE